MFGSRAPSFASASFASEPETPFGNGLRPSASAQDFFSPFPATARSRAQADAFEAGLVDELSRRLAQARGVSELATLGTLQPLQRTAGWLRHAARRPARCTASSCVGLAPRCGLGRTAAAAAHAAAHAMPARAATAPLRLAALRHRAPRRLHASRTRRARAQLASRTQYADSHRFTLLLRRLRRRIAGSTWSLHSSARSATTPARRRTTTRARWPAAGW